MSDTQSDHRRTAPELQRAFEELRAAYEDLQAAHDELRRENEALLADQRARALFSQDRTQGREQLFELITRDREKIRRLAETLERDRDMLQVIMENTHACLAYLDLRFNFVRVNSAYVEESGYSREELLGRNHFELFPDEENEAIFKRVRDTGEPVAFQARPFEYAGQPERGVTYWDWSLVPVKDAQGEVQGLVFSLLDVTERIRAEQELWAKEEQFRLVADFTYDWESWIGPDGSYLYVSPACERMTGYPPESFYEDPDLLRRITHPDDRHIFNGHVRERHQSHALQGVDFRVVTSEGEVRWINHLCQPVYDAGGNWLGYRSSNRDITDRKRAEQEREEILSRLEAKQALLMAILESAPEGIIVTDEQARVILSNPAAEILYAQPMSCDELDDLPERPHFDHAGGSPCDPRLEHLFKLTLEGRALHGVEVRIFPSQDESQDLLLNTAPIRDREGQITRAVGIFQDITRRKQVKEALHRSEEKLRALFQVLPIGISILDDERHIRLFNPALARILDLSQAQLAGGDYRGRTYLRADGNPMVHDEFPSNRALREQQPVRDVEIGIVKEDGEEIWTSVSAVPLSFSDWHVIVTTVDITRLKETERALSRARDELEQRVAARTAELRESEERFRQVTENIDEVLWLVEPDTGRMLYLNPAYETIWGIPLQEAPEYMDGILVNVHPEDQDRIPADLMTVWEGQEAEFRILRPDGQVRWLRTRAFPIYDESGRPYRLAGIAQDITEEKRALAALIDAEQLAVAGKLATSLAHEINNPLQAAIGCLGLAQEQLEKGGDANSYLEVTADALERASRVVMQLRTLHQRAETEEKELVDLNEFVEKVLLLTRKKCGDCGVEVTWTGTPNLPELQLMPDAIQQVFLNLVLNALDAMPLGGGLHVSTSATRQPPGVQIRFTDEGTGISPETLERLFEPFYTTKMESLGLGLFISRNIVQQHGGRIEVESQQGEGSTFTIWLPLQEPEQMAAEER
ncbi:MAG: PAS domain S-box protein [Anaerolineae bacterium]